MPISNINIVFAEESVLGTISDFNLKARTFSLVTPAGERIVCHFSTAFHAAELLGKDLNTTFKNTLRIDGTMIKDHSTVRQMIVKTLTCQAVQDVPSRVQDLCLLKDGWFDGEGKALPKDGAQWFIDTWSKEWPRALCEPYTYPSLDNDILLEWPFTGWGLSAQIDLSGRCAYVHVCNLKDRLADAVEADLDLDTPEGWLELIRFVRSAAA